MDLSSIRSFPPFYTQQPHSDTLKRQLAWWVENIKDYCHKHRLFIIDNQSDVFESKEINRQVKDAFKKEILRFAVSQGLLERLNEQYMVWWLTCGQWAEAMCGHVVRSGLSGSVVTVFELFGEGAGTDWQGMPKEMYMKILNFMQKKGLLALIEYEDNIMGVKFA